MILQALAHIALILATAYAAGALVVRATPGGERVASEPTPKPEPERVRVYIGRRRGGVWRWIPC